MLGLPKGVFLESLMKVISRAMSINANFTLEKWRSKMNRIKASKLLNATKSFFVVRAIVYLIITLIMLVVSILTAILCINLLVNEKAFIAIVIAIIVFGGLLGFLAFAKRYCLYMIKAAHISAITEYIKTGQIPVTEKGYSGVLSYGKEIVTKNFGAANIAFAADTLIAGATRQIMRWLNKAENLLSFIPGASVVFGFVNMVLSVALNYIDEAVLSFVFFYKEEKNGFKKVCDGLVYYAQSWKGMLKSAFKVGILIWLFRIASYLLFFFIVTSIVTSTGGIIAGLLVAFVLLYALENILVEPFATCVMVNDYHKAIAGQPLKHDMYNTLCKVSAKFKSLFTKASDAFTDSASQPDYAYAYAGAPQYASPPPPPPPYASVPPTPPQYAPSATPPPPYVPPSQYAPQPPAPPPYAPPPPPPYAPPPETAPPVAPPPAQGGYGNPVTYCGKCGAQIQPGAGFCGHCGYQMS